MLAACPDFLQRKITELGDFADFGGESYDEVQARARSFVAELEREHRAAESRVLLVAHGGINFQILKSLICEPVPRVCIVRMGNCSATLVRMRERRGSYLGEVVWHVPLELIEPRAPDAEGTTRIFR
jgi:broad specificity phosphatase PhoE